jgi:hypothetical protein
MKGSFLRKGKGNAPGFTTEPQRSQRNKKKREGVFFVCRGDTGRQKASATPWEELNAERARPGKNLSIFSQWGFSVTSVPRTSPAFRRGEWVVKYRGGAALRFADLQAGYLFEVVLVVGVDRGNSFFETPVAHDRIRKLYLSCLISDEGLSEHVLQWAL